MSVRPRHCPIEEDGRLATCGPNHENPPAPCLPSRSLPTSNNHKRISSPAADDGRAYLSVDNVTRVPQNLPRTITTEGRPGPRRGGVWEEQQRPQPWLTYCSKQLTDHMHKNLSRPLTPQRESEILVVGNHARKLVERGRLTPLAALDAASLVIATTLDPLFRERLRRQGLKLRDAERKRAAV